MLSYDIWCQYSINIQKRFEKWFPETSTLLPRIRGAVPKMHIKNHISSCQQLWAFNYIKYSGETWGENIEGGWAEQNQAAGSTKEQNDGHRHDTLDDFFGFWNWTKLHQLCEFPFFFMTKPLSCWIASTLYRMFETCVKTLKKREDAFDTFSSCQPKNRITTWEAMDDQPKLVDGTVVSVYEARFGNGMQVNHLDE